MSDYISREALIKAVEGNPYVTDSVKSYVRCTARSIPSADVHPVVKGKWIIHKPFDSGRHNCNECIECSVCGTWFGHDCYEISNFCPSCGADMRQTGDENV